MIAGLPVIVWIAAVLAAVFLVSAYILNPDNRWDMNP